MLSIKLITVITLIQEALQKQAEIQWQAHTVNWALFLNYKTCIASVIISFSIAFCRIDDDINDIMPV